MHDSEKVMLRKFPLWMYFLVLFPALMTFVSFFSRDRLSMELLFRKLIMMGLPFIVWFKRKYSFRAVLNSIGISRTNCLWGVISGILFAVIIIGGYHYIFKGFLPSEHLIEKISSLGLDGFYLPMALFLAFGNSLMEEFYWRGFLTAELKKYVTGVYSVSVLGGILFGLHHIFPLIHYFPGPLAWLFTAGTVFAAGFWTWLRMKGSSIINCYISHFISDLSIFWVGWCLLQMEGN